MLKMEKNEESIALFKKLTVHRTGLAQAIEQPALSGLQRSVVDKYSDQAHFIYELLQNADDAKARNAKFILTEDGLIFIHNGTVRFSVSDPDQEDIDTQQRRLGHVNSITSIGNTTKNEAKIGKFGVGFKAVFQYTSTPHIYDCNFSFKIERFIVPSLLENDHEFRQPNETLFYFPFDKPEKLKDECFKEILEKLKSLTFPVLFLRNLEEIVWESNNENGQYTKLIEEERKEKNIVSQLISLSDGKNIKRLWLFTREIGKNSDQYSIGFFLTDDQKLDSSQKYPAFCFFPTKETTYLKFILHAPFLLTDSRESIKAGNNWNKELVNKLAQLTADSLPILKNLGIEKQAYYIDDNLINLIPYNSLELIVTNESSKISFYPFYLKIKEILNGTNEILPSCNNTYSSKINSYWASDSDLIELFSNEQISALLANQKAKWVFTSIGRKNLMNEREIYFNVYKPIKAEYIDSIIAEFEDPEKLLRKLDHAFIKKQTLDWLNKLYSYLIDKKSYWEIVRRKPIFINSHNEVVSAYDEKTGKILKLFLPTVDNSDYPTIHKDFLGHEDSMKFFVNFGITAPSVKDDIYNNILPLYKAGIDISQQNKIRHHFNLFIQYYDECPQRQKNEYINALKECVVFAVIRNSEADLLIFKKAEKLYFPDSDLIDYFQFQTETHFVDLEFYNTTIPGNYKELFEPFLSELGISKTPRIYSRLVDDNELVRYKLYRSTQYSFVYEPVFDGAEQVIMNLSPKLSLLLWKYLCETIKLLGGLDRFKRKLNCVHEYYKYKEKEQFFISIEETRLKTNAWLYTKEGKPSIGKSISVKDLDEKYETKSSEGKALVDFLGIQNPDEDLNLDDQQLEDLELGRIFREKGLTKEEIPDLIKHYNRFKKAKEKNLTDLESSDENESDTTDQLHDTFRQFRNAHPKSDETTDQETEDEPIVQEEDDFIKSSADFEKKIKKLTEKVNDEISQLTKIQELTDGVNNSIKYSYIWFKSLLEMEYLNSAESKNSGKEISIKFDQVEKETGTAKTLILRYPNQPIPQDLEDIGDLSIKLFHGNDCSTVSIEVINVREHSIRAKLKKSSDITGLDLSSVHSAVIDIKNPIFILEELKNKFNSLNLEDNFNLQENLTENIEIIFGPPGTGKTTYLAKNVLIPKMQGKKDLKILVLTPTNKAADVLVKKIMEVSVDDDSYCEWLVRFGITGDPEIEKSAVFYDRSLDITSKSRNVTVTTIARFPYDFFKPDESESNEKYFLRYLDWDYIVFDEASMIPLVTMMYIIYFTPDAKFIVAGDPFQIQPISSVDIWKDENFYTLVGLNNFKNPTTVPHSYKIVDLPVQYRSVPSIGELFSIFTYDSVLKHYRVASSQKQLNIDGIRVNDINLIKFPVSSADSIYRAKKLNQSSNYQVYSAIFTFEFTKYIAAQIAKNHSDNFKIGVICPYKAQAVLIDQLLLTNHFENGNVEIQVGTIHGFQGDECDIIISIFNPPQYISNSPEMFLNKQNILNVAISRAKDYLFILIPDDRTENVRKLNKVQNIEKIVNRQLRDSCSQFHSSEIESIIFNDSRFIEKNAFSTAHQMVNVYSKSEMLYEIRCEESAIDVQIKVNNQ